METNLINNQEIKQKLGDSAIAMLINKNLISHQDIENLKVCFGYLFSNKEGMIVSLMKVVVNEEKTFYFDFKNSMLSLIMINEALFNETVQTMKTLHECLTKKEE